MREETAFSGAGEKRDEDIEKRLKTAGKKRGRRGRKEGGDPH